MHALSENAIFLLYYSLFKAINWQAVAPFFLRIRRIGFTATIFKGFSPTRWHRHNLGYHPTLSNDNLTQFFLKIFPFNLAETNLCKN
jgi:hypothetical protein